mgnify:CR=1 FL=1
MPNNKDKQDKKHGSTKDEAQRDALGNAIEPGVPPLSADKNEIPVKEDVCIDMLAEPARREAIEHARDTGEPALSRKIVLTLDSALVDRTAIFVIAPVYRYGAPTATVLPSALMAIACPMCPGSDPPQAK